MNDQSRPATGVALCLDGASSLDEEVLHRTLRGRAAPVLSERGLCQNRGALSAFVREHRLGKLAIGACGRPGEAPAIERELRAAGLAPWDAATVRLDWWGAGAKGRAALLLAGAIARLEAATPVRPDNYSIRLVPPPGPLSRRSLLGLASFCPRVVPSIDPVACAAWNGCRLCLDTCPKGALSIQGDGLRLNRVLCDGCGLCLAGCPAGAISFPGWMPLEVDALLQALLLTGLDSVPSRVVAFACPEAFTRLGRALGTSSDRLPSLLPVAVPSLGMAAPFLVLRSLSLGAAGVMLLSCSDGCRSHGRQGRLRERVPALRDLLASLGLAGFLAGPVELRGGPGPVPQECSEYVDEATGRGPRTSPQRTGVSVAQTFRTAPVLAEAAELLAADPATPVSGSVLGCGSIRLQAEACSLCGLCGAACPSRALTFSESWKKVTLRFVASRCVGCGLCVTACPESAIAIQDPFPLRDLSEVARGLRSSARAVCRRCGTALAPAAMASAVRRRLGENQRLAGLLEYCPDCRIIAALRMPQASSGDAPQEHRGAGVRRNTPAP